MTVPVVVVPPEAQPRTYLWFALLTTFAFCPPAGLIALFFSARVASRWLAGDRQGAWAAARAARNWSLTGVLLGLLLALTVVVWAGAVTLRV